MNACRDTLATVFEDIDLLLWSSEFIATHSTNTEDIREFALAGLDLHACREILDLACAFGYSTQALKERVHSQASIIGIDRCSGYKKSFLHSADTAGLSGEFCSGDVTILNNFKARRFDLVVCSYALYFFPEAIRDIARIIKPGGYFVTITHSQGHMRELVRIAKKCLFTDDNRENIELPIERLIHSFSDSNGMNLLSPWFTDISKKSYENSLQIASQDLDDLIKYFRFKQKFFIPEVQHQDEKTRSQAVDFLRQCLNSEKSHLISKNDTVFICKGPKYQNR